MASLRKSYNADPREEAHARYQSSVGQPTGLGQYGGGSGAVGPAQAYQEGLAAGGQGSNPADDVLAQSDKANTDYLNSFKANIAQSRQNITNQFQTALADINAGEGRGNAAINTLPPVLQGIYAPVAAQIDQSGKDSLAAQQATHLQSFEPAGTGTTGIKNAVAADSAARQADVPLLRLGAQQSFATQRSTLGAAEQHALGDIETQNNQGLLDYQKSQAAAQAAEAQQLQQREWQQEDAKQAHAWDLQKLGIQMGTPEQKSKQAAENFTAQNPEPPDKSSPEYASWLSHAHPNEYKSLINSPAFKYAQTSHSKGLEQVEDPEFGSALAWPLTGHPGLTSGPDANMPVNVSRHKLSLAELVKKYRGNKRLVGLLKLTYGGKG